MRKSLLLSIVIILVSIMTAAAEITEASELFDRGKVGVSGSGNFCKTGIVPGTGIGVSKKDGNGRPGCLPVVGSGDNLRQVGFLAGGGSGFSTLSSSQILQEIAFLDRHACRRAVDDDAHRNTVRFAKNADSKKVAECIHDKIVYPLSGSKNGS